MKSTELRIGNLVYGVNRRTEIHIPETIPLKVLQIELFNCEVLPYDKNPALEKEFIKISNEDISPIQLSEEWLLKFGFEKNYAFYRKNRFGVIDKPEGFYYNDGFDNSTLIKYVHQLQNLYFALTGEELTIK